MSCQVFYLDLPLALTARISTMMTTHAMYLANIASRFVPIRHNPVSNQYNTFMKFDATQG